GHGSLDGVEEFAKLHGAMAPMTPANHFPRFHVEGRKQRRRAVAHVVVRAPLDLPGSHRQQWLRAIERLDLGFFVDAKDERVLGRIQVEPDNVPDFVDEERIARELERLRAMRLEARSEEHTSELQSRFDLVCRLLLEKKKNKLHYRMTNTL